MNYKFFRCRKIKVYLLKYHTDNLPKYQIKLNSKRHYFSFLYFFLFFLLFSEIFRKSKINL